jgi:hypothetical protein
MGEFHYLHILNHIKMRPKLHQLCGALAMMSVVMFSACSKQDSDGTKPDQQADGKISYEMVAVNPTSRLSGDATTGAERLASITNNPTMAKTTSFDFTWTEVLVRVRELKFAAKKGDSEVAFSAKVDKLVDVLKAIGFLGVIDIPKGTYKYVKVYVKIAGEEPKPAAIMSGKITWDGKDIPFTIRLSGTATMKADAKNVVVSDTSLTFKGKLKLDLKLVMAKLQVGDFTGTMEGGHLVINISVNDDRGKKVRDGLENGVSCDHRRGDD